MLRPHNAHPEIAMRSLSDHLSNYAAYHQDGRNIATHFVGIPAIVLAVWLSRRHCFCWRR
jgi:uncharacterized membrane protein YGL010W